MDMSKHPDSGRPLNGSEDLQGMQAPDLPALLSKLKARQDMGATAQRMQAGDLPARAGDEPSRLALIFAPTGEAETAIRWASGAFHTGVAARLAMGTNREDDVYSGV